MKISFIPLSACGLLVTVVVLAGCALTSTNSGAPPLPPSHLLHLPVPSRLPRLHLHPSPVRLNSQT